ncbi:MAG TPA: hypothetical protein VNB54_05450 [Alphaproteobacteria bacterium]|nr:hypothetical protein [Alphaproteobacteria bacterium]
MAVFLFRDCIQLHQFSFKDLQPALKFLDLVLEFALDIGRFARLVADVNIHVCLGWEKIPLRKVRRPSFFADSTPANMTPTKFRMLLCEYVSGKKFCKACLILLPLRFSHWAGAQAVRSITT